MNSILSLHNIYFILKFCQPQHFLSCNSLQNSFKYMLPFWPHSQFSSSFYLACSEITAQNTAYHKGNNGVCVCVCVCVCNVYIIGDRRWNWKTRLNFPLNYTQKKLFKIYWRVLNHKYKFWCFADRASQHIYLSN